MGIESFDAICSPNNLVLKPATMETLMTVTGAHRNALASVAATDGSTQVKPAMTGTRTITTAAPMAASWHAVATVSYIEVSRAAMMGTQSLAMAAIINVGWSPVVTVEWTQVSGVTTEIARSETPAGTIACLPLVATAFYATISPRGT